MGSLSEAFSTLNDVLLADYQLLQSSKNTLKPRRLAESDILLNRLLRNFSPQQIRFGSGNIVDVMDREVGPWDVIAHADNFPAPGDAKASLFLVDGVIYALAVSHDWQEPQLRAFSELAMQLRGLQRKEQTPMFCGLVDFGSLPFGQAQQFLQLPISSAIDLMFSVGQYSMIRNRQGWYGSVQEVPWVTERGGPEALKAFALFLLQIAQNHLGLPFTYADYQHL